MTDFIPKTSKNTDSGQLSTSQESNDFVPYKSQLSDTDYSKKNTAEFQQKKPAPIEQSSVSSDALKGVEVPSVKDSSTNPSEDSTTDAPNDSSHEFKVRIIRDGERITKMIVECKCGETIPLDCIY